MSEIREPASESCVVCNQPSEELVPFFVKCSAPEMVPFAVKSECCRSCIARVRKKEILAPVGALGFGLMTAPLIALGASRRFVLDLENTSIWWLVIPGCVGVTLVVAYAMSCWVVGRTDFQQFEFKRFVVQTSRARLQSYAPTMELKTSKPKNCTVIEVPASNSQDVD